MKKYALAAIVAIVFIGCGDDSRSNSRSVESTSTQVPAQATTTTVYSGGGDVTINSSYVTGHGTYIQNSDGTVTYTVGDDNTVGDKSSSAADKPTGDYPGEEADEQECTDAGYFFCPLSGKCLDQPATQGSCTAEAAMSIDIRLQ